MLLRGSLFLAERLRAKCVGGPEVHWEYQAVDEEEWRPFPSQTSRQIESHFTQSGSALDKEPGPEDGTCSEVLTVAFPSEEPLKSRVEVRLPDPDAICASPHGKMFREHQGSRSSDSELWKVRRQCTWHHFAGDIFIEGAALVVGFLLMQSILLYHTGYLHSVEGLLQKPERWDFLLTSKILGWSAIFGILVPVVAKSSAWLPGFCATDAELLRESCSAALAWCLVRGAALAVRPHCSVMDTYIVVAFPLTWLAFVVTGFAYGMPSHDMEVSHSIANAFGIVVGLAWDKAFESLALQITAGWYGHYVVSKILLAAAVFVSILPGWYWYLVPRALLRRSEP